MRNVIDALEERGFIEALTSGEIRKLVNQPMKVYVGFDPTGESLHLGNLIAIMGLAWFQRFGHTPVAIVGGATGMIGDPSGKSHERNLLDAETIERNLRGIRANLESVLDFNHSSATPVILNNYDWFKNFGYLEFLREIGKHFRMGPMLAKESVRSRLSSEEGISYTEFSYQLLQSYDFLHLYDTYGVSVQMGGSDQWGNITAGAELIRKLRGGSAFGITFPLLTRSDGKKFGKSESGAIWLSPEKLSPYEFYQYLFRTPDADVIKMMRVLTFMDMSEIREFEGAMRRSDYTPNTAQRRLAEEVTRIVHGQEGVDMALRVTQGVTPGSSTELNLETLENISKEMPNRDFPKQELLGLKIIDLITKLELVASKGEARRLLKNGGVYLNNQKIEDENRLILSTDLIDNKLLLIAIGKKNKVLVHLS